MNKGLDDLSLLELSNEDFVREKEKERRHKRKKKLLYLLCAMTFLIIIVTIWSYRYYSNLKKLSSKNLIMLEHILHSKNNGKLSGFLDKVYVRDADLRNLLRDSIALENYDAFHAILSHSRNRLNLMHDPLIEDSLLKLHRDSSAIFLESIINYYASVYKVFPSSWPVDNREKGFLQKLNREYARLVEQLKKKKDDERKRAQKIVEETMRESEIREALERKKKEKREQIAARKKREENQKQIKEWEKLVAERAKLRAERIKEVKSKLSIVLKKSEMLRDFRFNNAVRGIKIEFQILSSYHKDIKTLTIQCSFNCAGAVYTKRLQPDTTGPIQPNKNFVFYWISDKYEFAYYANLINCMSDGSLKFDWSPIKVVFSDGKAYNFY